MLRTLKRKIRKQLYFFSGEVDHLRPSVKIPVRWYGTMYGGFFACPLHLGRISIVYSVGIGEDISFDLELIRIHGCNVWGFDPTPKSVAWMARKIVPDEFHFCPIGLGPTDGSLEFFLPKDESNVSGSFCKQRNVNYSESISLEMRQLSSIAKDLEHSHIDLLKIDIEGFEYDVFQSIIDSGLTIDQICVEFHDRFFPNIPRRSLNSIQQLKSAGFEVFAVSDSLEEVSLIHRRVLGQ